MNSSLTSTKVKDLGAHEFDPYYKSYVAILGDAVLGGAFADSLKAITKISSEINAKGLLHYSYQDKKWSIAEVLQHLIDTELIFQYRALRIIRGDKTPLAGFDQDDYVLNSRALDRTLDELQKLMTHVRKTTVLLFEMCNEAELKKLGSASGASISVRALGFLICGHQKHHFKIIEERYF